MFNSSRYAVLKIPIRLWLRRPWIARTWPAGLAFTGPGRKSAAPGQAKHPRGFPSCLNVVKLVILRQNQVL